MMRRRVVITGLGCVTPLGSEVHTVWNRLTAGRSGVGRLTLFDASRFQCSGLLGKPAEDRRIASLEAHDTLPRSRQLDKLIVDLGLRPNALAAGRLAPLVSTVAAQANQTAIRWGVP
jgi:3-oxoacyl-(acyl-carrier-protein) synthase